MPAWNFAVLVDAIARDTPDREAVVHGARRITWQQLASRGRSLAWYMQNEAGLASGDKVAIVLPNCPEYLETFVAARKLRCVPLNIGIGSSLEALQRMIDATDAKAVVCSPAMAGATHEAIRRIPKRWRPLIIEVGGRDERGIAATTPPLEWDVETPSGDDLIYLATQDVASGGTEFGMPLLPAAPFALGNNLAAALGTLSRRGSVVFVDSAVFDPGLVWLTVDTERVVTLTIGGDSFARPLLAALPSATGGRPLTALRTISSSGARLSRDVANGLEAALEHVTIVDAYEETEQRAPGPQQMIHPSQVEAMLRKHASVSDCVVVGVSDPRIGKIVVALVQISKDHYLDATELATWCRAHLPSSLTPARFVFVEKIDRSPSGQADYQALRAVAIERLVREQRGDTPR